jgi:hypothetical protein
VWAPALTVQCWARDKDHAIKIASEKRKEWLVTHPIETYLERPNPREVPAVGVTGQDFASAQLYAHIWHEDGGVTGQAYTDPALRIVRHEPKP